jgi:hypothetical protein
MFGLLSTQLQNLKRGLAYVPPVILLVSDGMPTDDYAEQLARFLELTDASDATRLCIAAGPDASLEFCRSFTDGMAFDALKAPTASKLEAAIQSIADSCAAILDNSKGARVPVPLPRSTALPAMMTTVSDEVQEGEGAILSATRPLVGKHFGAIASIRCQTSPEEQVDLDRLLETAIEMAAKQTGSPEDMVDLVAESFLTGVREELSSGEVQLLSLALATPASTAIISQENLLAGFDPPLPAAKTDWITSTLGKEFRKCVVPAKISFVMSSPEFCESFGYGAHADALAAELTKIYRDRGASYVSTARAAWATRARGVTGSSPFALTVLYDVD